MDLPEACPGFFSSGADSIFRKGKTIFIRGRNALKKILPLIKNLPLGHNRQEGSGAEYRIKTKQRPFLASALIKAFSSRAETLFYISSGAYIKEGHMLLLI